MEVEDVQSIMSGILLGLTAMPSLEIGSPKISLCVAKIYPWKNLA